jgi:hypothetical protein
MRFLSACAVLFFAALGAAQTTDPLQSLGFLIGIWTAEDHGALPETTEFHWAERQGSTVLVGRHWTGDDGGCPWCVTQAAILVYYDKDANQVHALFRDKAQRSLDFVMASALEDSAQFFSVPDPGMPVFRLIFKPKPPNNISIALEEAPSQEGVFSPVFDWSLHRRPVLGPASPDEIR